MALSMSTPTINDIIASHLLPASIDGTLGDIMDLSV
jgi:hypothetical protein